MKEVFSHIIEAVYQTNFSKLNKVESPIEIKEGEISITKKNFSS